MSEALKPCPFCGGRATMVTGPTAGLSEIGEVDPVRYVLCDDCAASSFDDHVTEEDAAGAWNARADTECRQSAISADVSRHSPAVSAARREALEEAAHLTLSVGRMVTDGLVSHGRYEQGYARAREDCHEAIRALAQKEASNA